jgi:hypothetical protein
MKLFLIIMMIFLFGCNETDSDRDIEYYRCNEEQLNLIKLEMEICSQTSYFSSYCFLQAKKTHCTFIEKNITNTEK